MHLCGSAASVQSRWRGGRECWRPGVRARREGWRSQGAVEASGGVAVRPGAGSRHPWSATSPAGLACASRVVRRARAGGGKPGQPNGGSALRPALRRHPATRGRSVRTRGASRGAAMLASSLRTRDGLGRAPCRGGGEGIRGARSGGGV